MTMAPYWGGITHPDNGPCCCSCDISIEFCVHGFRGSGLSGEDGELINKWQGTHFAMWANVHLEVGKTHTHTHTRARTHTHTHSLLLIGKKRILFYLPGGTVVKSLFVNAGDTGDAVSIPGLGRSPGVGNDTPTPVFLPGKFHGQKILVGYSL